MIYINRFNIPWHVWTQDQIAVVEGEYTATGDALCGVSASEANDRNAETDEVIEAVETEFATVYAFADAVALCDKCRVHLYDRYGLDSRAGPSSSGRNPEGKRPKDGDTAAARGDST